MGTSQSKSSPDVQMRMKMESGLDEEDEDVEVFGLSERDKATRSKSNLSGHTERFHNEDDDYFNKFYNKKSEKSLSSLNGSSVGIKSAPVGSKKEKDPEIAAAIEELEETFKVLGDGPLTGIIGDESQILIIEDDTLSSNGSTSLDSPSPNPGDELDQCNYPDLTEQFSFPSGQNHRGAASTSQIPDRHLISRAGDSNNVIDHNGYQRRHSRILDTSRTLDSSGHTCTTQSSNGSSSHIMTHSRGSEQKNFILPNHSNYKRGKTHNSQSILMQQRKEFQKRQIDPSSASESMSSKISENDLNREDWTYEPPKIDGFDVQKFKEINSKEIQSTILPSILRDEEDKGYYSRSPDIPSYTKDELELIASLESEVY